MACVEETFQIIVTNENCLQTNNTTRKEKAFYQLENGGDHFVHEQHDASERTLFEGQHFHAKTIVWSNKMGIFNK